MLAEELSAINGTKICPNNVEIDGGCLKQISKNIWTIRMPQTEVKGILNLLKKWATYLGKSTQQIHKSYLVPMIVKRKLEFGI